MVRPLASFAAAMLRLAIAGVLASLWITSAGACELCLQAANERLNLVDRLASAERVVLARLDNESGKLMTVLSIKGDERAGNVLSGAIVPLYGLPFRPPLTMAVDPSKNEPILLAGDGIRGDWTSLGTIGEGNADWLRALAATPINPGIDPGGIAQGLSPPPDGAQIEGWRKRVLRALPHLGGRLRTLERELAWSEIVRAPYAALPVVVGHLSPEQLAQWLDDPVFASHLGGVLHLYGFVGGAEGASRINQWLARAAVAHDTTWLGPLLVADLELEGPSRLDWIETTYFADRSRSLPEIQAALFAVKLQGQADRTIPRSQAIDALRRFIALRPAMADGVAITFAGWNYWGAEGDYKAILASGVMVDPASAFAVTLYLQRAAAATQVSHR